MLILLGQLRKRAGVWGQGIMGVCGRAKAATLCWQICSQKCNVPWVIRPRHKGVLVPAPQPTPIRTATSSALKRRAPCWLCSQWALMRHLESAEVTGTGLREDDKRIMARWGRGHPDPIGSLQKWEWDVHIYHDIPTQQADPCSFYAQTSDSCPSWMTDPFENLTKAWNSSPNKN